MFPHHTRTNECCQLAGHAASSVVLGTLQDHRAFPCNGIDVSPGSANFFEEASLHHRYERAGRLMSPKSSVLRVASARTLENVLQLCLTAAHACPREFRSPDSSRSTNCLSLSG